MPTATKKTAASKRGRGSEPEMDFAALTPKAAKPVSRAKQEASNPFLAIVARSAEETGASKGEEGAYEFGGLKNEKAAKQVASLLSRAAEIKDVGMSITTTDGKPYRKVGNQYAVHWQAKPERTRRPRKDKEDSES